MDDVITRILEIEKQCSADVERAEVECAKRIEAHKRLLEEKRILEHARILDAQRTRLTEAIEEAKARTEAASTAFWRDSEALFHDPALQEKAKRKIISILLGS
jgi:hypothetical protein